MEQINNAVNVETQELNSLRVYNCGGAGIGVGKYFEQERNKAHPGHAQVFPVYMDTSKASTFGVPDEHFYQLPEKNGSGGVRRFNGPDIIRYTGEMLQRFPAMENNIVIHSTTGGSGSVMGPSIASELLAQGKSVIVFAIGADDTLNYIENSIATMESYESICNLRETGMLLRYLQNGVDGTVEEVDEAIRLDISCLTVLYSGQNKNLDHRDLFNWSHFTEVTTYGPQIGILSIHKQTLELPSDSNLISVATLNSDLNNTKVGHPVEFQRVGVPMTIVTQDMPLMYPLHFAVTDGFLDVVIKNLRKQVKDYQLKAESRVVRNQIGSNKPAQKNGIVF